ncbi:hypothetical protein DSO57_1008520 [Entomophthora muscae]|uniref:Uncharacterized protein n=1 Tax=Entomophthora muscae TaxID=34485 RepID=A0ACC2UG25_9FUNG|nr:hypothetical protein DSO57_1008520 [Entomophthora muscae]
MYQERLACTLIQLQSEAYSDSLAKKIRDQERDNKKRFNLPKFSVGDWVLFHNTHDNGCAHKLAAIWIGPFEIINKTFTDTYTIKDVKDGRLVNQVHTNFLRKFNRKD